MERELVITAFLFEPDRCVFVLAQTDKDGGRLAADDPLFTQAGGRWRGHGNSDQRVAVRVFRLPVCFACACQTVCGADRPARQARVDVLAGT